MTQRDSFEREILEAYEAGKLEPIATKAELARLREAARATAVKDRRVNIRMSAGDLRDIRMKAMQEGMPYQTLIASVLHNRSQRTSVRGAEPQATAQPADGQATARRAEDPVREPAGRVALTRMPGKAFCGCSR